VEQEWLNANGQLANELTNANEFVRDLEYKKSQVEQKLVDEQVFNFIKKIYCKYFRKFEAMHMRKLKN